MPVDPQTGVWLPSISPKQLAVFNSQARYLLVSGPRMSGKSIGVFHKLLRHAWETPDARIAMFAKTVKNAKSGVWADITGPIIREWLNAGLTGDGGEFRYTVEPKIDGATRMHYFKVENYWGGESEIQLHSLDYDGDIEDKIMSTRYSCIYFSELQMFSDKRIFDVSVQQLRMAGLPYHAHMWIADTNPPETGPDHFAFELWFRQRTMENHPDPVFQKNLELIEISIEENPFADPDSIRDLKSTYRFDPEGWDRYVIGKWTRGAGNAEKHFGTSFNRNVHVMGEAEDFDESKWEVLLPSDKCMELISGWDLGHTNHSFTILEKRLDANGQPCFDVLDELVSVNEKVSIEEFGLAAVEHIDALERFLGRPIRWTHWSDTSAFRYNAGGLDPMDSATVERISQGKIQFTGAYSAKTPGSLRKRVELLKRLLRQNRILVSAHCFKTIEMFENLKRGRKELDYISRGDPQKHPFDSLSYPVYSECLAELEIGPPRTGSSLITLPF